MSKEIISTMNWNYLVLKEALVQEKKTESRIDQLENEIEGIKKKLAAKFPKSA